MERSVAQGRAPDPRPDRPDERPAAPWRSIGIGAALVLAALVVYAAVHTPRIYNHFVWQAEAFLDGQTSIRYPVAETADSPGNAVFNDVFELYDEDGRSTGRGLIPFPPLPALVLLPFVAIWGLATDQQLIGSVLAAIDVGLAWWMLGRLRVSVGVRLATTLFFAFGTVFWYAGQLATTWYFAHIVALALLFLAIGLALGADPDAQEDEDDLPEPPAEPGAAARLLDLLSRPWRLLDRRQFLVGLLFGLAATARLTVLFGAPFFVLVGSGGSWPRRAVSAGLGALLPVAGLLVYNVVSTGHLFHPAYEYLYLAEAHGYPSLGYHPAWSIEDPRYIPQNLALMLFSTPAFLPDQIPAALGAYGELCAEPGAVRSLFDADCPLALPRDVGMSLLLTSPAYLLAIPALRLHGRSRLVTGAVIAVLLIAIVNLMHFSQGWVQFGYRFSNDFVPFVLLLVAIGVARRNGVGVLAVVLLVASILVNLWGVYWGNALGW